MIISIATTTFLLPADLYSLLKQTCRGNDTEYVSVSDHQSSSPVPKSIHGQSVDRDNHGEFPVKDIVACC